MSHYTSHVNALCAILLLMVMCCVPSFAAPVIDFTTQSQYMKVAHGESVNFMVTANESIDTWEWYVNGNAKGVNLNAITIVFDGRGQDNVTVTATNSNGIASYSFYPYIHRETTSAESVIIEDTGFSKLRTAISGGDFEGFFGALTVPGVSVMGGFYYLFVLGLPFYMMWNRQQNLLVPSVLGLIIGVVIMPMMPEQYIKFFQLVIVLGSAAVVWSLYKDR